MSWFFDFFYLLLNCYAIGDMDVCCVYVFTIRLCGVSCFWIVLYMVVVLVMSSFLPQISFKSIADLYFVCVYY